MKKRKDKTDVSGLFGDSVTVRKANNRVVVENRPKRTGKKRRLTENEENQRERFREASRYASSVQQDEALRAIYAARKRGKYESAYTVALADFHNPPKISAIEVHPREVGDKDEIQVNASDDFMVVRVTVEIVDTNGRPIEKGEATQNQDKYINGWFSIPSLAQPIKRGMRITAAAYDRPGNRTVKELEL